MRTATNSRIIYLKERNFNMLKKELIFRNPLRLMGYETEDILQSGGFGAVLARAGLGKTAILVQLALDSLLRSRNVLHISLDDSVKKVCLWYEEVFRNISDQYNIRQIEQLWEAVVSHRLIMTFKVDSFSVPKLEERLTDLKEQNIFLPQVILIDGLPFDKDIRKPLTELKKLAESRFMHISDLFDVIIQLQPEGKEIHVKALKGGPAACDYPELLLDTSTMLVKG
jgi:hypothetical protein